MRWGLGLLPGDLQERIEPMVDRGRPLNDGMRIPRGPLSSLDDELEQVAGRVVRVVPENDVPGTRRLEALAALDPVVGPVRSPW